MVYAACCMLHVACCMLHGLGMWVSTIVRVDECVPRPLRPSPPPLSLDTQISLEGVLEKRGHGWKAWRNRRFAMDGAIILWVPCLCACVCVCRLCVRAVS